MAALSGSFTGPGVTGSVAYAAGGAVTFSIDGEWPRALINTEVSQDGGATWNPVWGDFGINGASKAGWDGKGPQPPRPPGTSAAQPPGPGLFRLRCLEFRSGWCNWTISA